VQQNTPQLAAWVQWIRQNQIRRRKFWCAPSARGEDKNFQGFASLLPQAAINPPFFAAFAGLKTGA